MQNRIFAVGGLEDAYMRKFALYLSKRMGDGSRVGIVDDLHQIEMWDSETIWIGSENFISQVRICREDASCIILSEEETPEEDRIFRYQSCEKICQKILFLAGRGGRSFAQGAESRQKWVVLTADCTASQLLAFSVTLAGLLHAKGRVLYLNLSECSGMGELFLMEPGTDFSDLILGLRGEDTVTLEPFVRRLEQMDCILPPENAMILHEIRGTDMEKLIQVIQQEEQYVYVVVAAGCSCCGFDLLLRRACRVFHLTREGESFPETQRAWIRMIGRCLEDQKDSVIRVSVPEVLAGSEGIHLLYEWAEGPLGQLAASCLEKEAEWK